MTSEDTTVSTCGKYQPSVTPKCVIGLLVHCGSQLNNKWATCSQTFKIKLAEVISPADCVALYGAFMQFFFWHYHTLLILRLHTCAFHVQVGQNVALTQYQISSSNTPFAWDWARNMLINFLAEWWSYHFLSRLYAKSKRSFSWA